MNILKSGNQRYLFTLSFERGKQVVLANVYRALGKDSFFNLLSNFLRLLFNQHHYQKDRFAPFCILAFKNWTNK